MNERTFDTHVQGLKYKAIRELIKAYDEGRLDTAYIDIPKIAIKGPKAELRCCIYKERAIFQERLGVINAGMDKSTKCAVQVLDIACDECPADGMLVTQACRGCLSHRCKEVCPKDAITIVDKRCVIDKSKCIQCGRCQAACPYGAILKQVRPCVSGCKVNAISIDPETEKAVVDEDKCISCGACVRNCPFGAIQDRSQILKTVQMLKDSDNGKNFKVYAIVAPSIVSQFKKYAGVEQVVTGIKQLGFHAVVEAAFGADVCLQHEAHEWQEKGVLTTSCCPAFVNFIEKNFPDLKKYVSSSLSPMMETARTLKKGDPDCKCVFIGPCAAKKMEVNWDKTQGLVETAISFEELQAFFDARAVDVANLQPTNLDDASFYGRIFAKSGGIRQGLVEVASKSGIEGLNPIAMNGIAECKVALLKLRAGKALENFFEGMSCEGGCINGPLCLHQGAGNAVSVDNYGKQASRTTIDESVRQWDAGIMDIQK